MSDKNWFRVVSAAALVAAFSWVGCSDEDNFETSTSIFGTVVDGAGNGILGIHVGIVYVSRPLTSAPKPAAEPPFVRLDPPYPNPASQSVPLVSIPVIINADSDTTLSLEVRTNTGGVTEHVVLLFEGAVTQDTTFLWDLEGGFSEPVPNGVYYVRLTVPANAPQGVTAAVTQETLLVSTSITDMPFLGISNTVTDGKGEFFIDDIAVEERFTATTLSGQILGEAVVENRILMLFWDPALPTQTVLREETIFKGETIEKVTQFP